MTDRTPDRWGSEQIALHTRNEELAAEVARLRGKLAWRPIETAPKDSLVLIWSPENGVAVGEYAWTEDAPSGPQLAFQTSGLPAEFPTHWMPLPEPPTTEATQ